MDYTPASRRLSEISHLFLSDVRQKQGEATRPTRTPPGAFKGDVSVDLTPEEFARVMQQQADEAEAGEADFKPVRAVIAHHLGETMTDRVRDLAVAVGGGEPVGIIYAGATGVRLCFVDPAAGDCDADEVAPEPLNVLRLREAVIELDQDVGQWLLVLPDHRAPDTHHLMTQVKDWTLLAGADHDGVVAAYRALKGLCGDGQPNLSVAVFGTSDAAEVHKTAKKLAGVCEQFLKVTLAVGPTVAEAANVREICLVEASADGSSESHWPLLAELAAGAAPAAAVVPAAPVVQLPPPVVAFHKPSVNEPVMRMTQPQSTAAADDALSVIDLPENDATPAGILRAVIAGGGQFAESPVKAPALPDGVVAVSTADRRLTLLAVARPGLADLRPIAAAFRWMNENRALIAMAAAGLSIDAFAEPHLHVLVDPADTDAAAVHPLLAASTVSVASYRRVRWAGRTGLLLNAA